MVLHSTILTLFLLVVVSLFDIPMGLMMDSSRIQSETNLNKNVVEYYHFYDKHTCGNIYRNDIYTATSLTDTNIVNKMCVSDLIISKYNAGLDYHGNAIIILHRFYDNNKYRYAISAGSNKILDTKIDINENTLENAVIEALGDDYIYGGKE